MRAAAPLLITFVQGCGPHCELGSVPVHGGWDTQKSTVRETLQELEASVALPVCIDHVRIGRAWERWRAEGAYNSVTRGVRLLKTVEGEDLARNLRHEVCHGVDMQNDLLKGREALFYYPEDELEPEISDRRLVKEAFATICQDGAAPLSALWPQDCPSDPDLEGTYLVRREVYGLDEPPPAARFEPIGSAVFPLANRLSSCSESESGALNVWLRVGEETRILSLDPWTGQAVEEHEGSAGRPPLEVPPAPAGWQGLEDLGGATLPDGTGVGIAMFRAWVGTVFRTFAWVGGDYAPVDAPCPNSSTLFFWYGSEIWSAQLDGETLSWGRWRSLR